MNPSDTDPATDQKNLFEVEDGSGTLQEQDLPDVARMHLDETQLGYGQDCISVFLNQKHRAILVCRGHTEDALNLFPDRLMV